jgi:Mrp family chromosome partitioning ATPase
MEFWVLVREGKVEKSSYVTDGCGTSHACGSMATCLAEGKSLDQAVRLKQQDILAALEGLPKESEHCALLAANTLTAACKDYRRSLARGARKTSSPEKTCGDCDDPSCSASQRQARESDQEFEDRQKLAQRLCRIRHKIIVLSGKGGVGKSTVAANLALSLAAQGKKTGLLDVDIHGPSVPKMLGLEGYPIEVSQEYWVPVPLGDNLKVMSIGFLLRGRDEAVIWRGPIKMGVIKQFLRDVEWGELDYLVIDSPPGTGDEPLSVIQLIEGLDGAVVVTTPQDISIIDVRRSIKFCRAVKTPVLGVIENMSGFVCPHCGKTTDIFKSGGGENMAKEMKVPFLGRIPLDPRIAQACDQGTPYVQALADSPSARAFAEAIALLISAVEKHKDDPHGAISQG